MLCPEIWDFKAPQHYLNTQCSSLTLEGSHSVIRNHYFNHSVSVVLPNSKVIPAQLQESILDDSDYYKVESLSVPLLIDKEFIEAFVKKGELSLLSVDVKIDQDNCVAITPTGQLILSLVLEDYQKLGLEGIPSYFDRKRHTRYSK